MINWLKNLFGNKTPDSQTTQLKASLAEKLEHYKEDTADTTDYTVVEIEGKIVKVPKVTIHK